jgi:hypothetical protein
VLEISTRYKKIKTIFKNDLIDYQNQFNNEGLKNKNYNIRTMNTTTKPPNDSVKPPTELIENSTSETTDDTNLTLPTNPLTEYPTQIAAPESIEEHPAAMTRPPSDTTNIRREEKGKEKDNSDATEEDVANSNTDNTNNTERALEEGQDTTEPIEESESVNAQPNSDFGELLSSRTDYSGLGDGTTATDSPPADNREQMHTTVSENKDRDSWWLEREEKEMAIEDLDPCIKEFDKKKEIDFDPIETPNLGNPGLAEPIV